MSDSKPFLLYLDDEEINLIIFKEMFKKDFEIVTTQSQEEAIEHARNHHLDFILTDQLMPNMTGVEFLKELKFRKIAVGAVKVIISGFTKEGDVNEALKSKLIEHFISKPWSYPDLKHLLLGKS